MVYNDDFYKDYFDDNKIELMEKFIEDFHEQEFIDYCKKEFNDYCEFVKYDKRKL
jgi:hypothetical protein